MSKRNVNYIIVGQGIAGSTMVQKCIEHNKSFVVIDEQLENQSSKVAAGLWNPIVLKRMKRIADADEMLAALHPFYKTAEKLFNTSVFDDIKVQRIFANAEEVNDWIAKSDHPNFSELMTPKIIQNRNMALKASFGLGEVLVSGRIKTEVWLNAVRLWLAQNNLIIEELFTHELLVCSENTVSYKNINADAIIFCEGMHAAFKNPYFKHLPYNLTKGELLLIKAPLLKVNAIINGGVFILPLGDDHYKIGATYEWDDLDNIPSEKGKKELQQKLDKIINTPYQIVDHQCGIRPTINDRRPLLGHHAEHKNLYIFNGLGSRGIMLAPYLAQHFFEYLLCETPIPYEMNINRFS